MDRFIEKPILFAPQQMKYLKSNMDRFIDPCNDEISYTDNI